MDRIDDADITENADGGADSQSEAGGSAGSDTDAKTWKARHDGQLKTVQRLTAENEKLRAGNERLTEVIESVRSLDQRLENIELSSAEMYDYVRKGDGGADDLDVYGSTSGSPATSDGDSKAAEVRARNQARQQKAFATRLNSVYNEIKANIVQGMDTNSPLMTEALADYNAGKSGQEPYRLELAREKVKLARREFEMSQASDPPAGDTPPPDGGSQDNDAGDETDEGAKDPKPAAEPNRKKLDRAGAFSEQAGGGEAAKTDKFADASPFEMFQAASRGEGPARS